MADGTWGHHRETDYPQFQKDLDKLSSWTLYSSKPAEALLEELSISSTASAAASAALMSTKSSLLSLSSAAVVNIGPSEGGCEEGSGACGSPEASSAQIANQTHKQRKESGDHWQRETAADRVVDC